MSMDTIPNDLDALRREAKRLQKAYDTGDSAAEISRRLGYSSPAYFSRAFLAHAGVTPGAVRANQPKATTTREFGRANALNAGIVGN